MKVFPEVKMEGINRNSTRGHYYTTADIITGQIKFTELLILRIMDET